jgi:eukaryotic-like serine/threonine-protein kinase
VFARRGAGAEPAGLFRMAVASGETRRLTRAEGHVDLAPAFSPDGRRLAFARCRQLACRVAEIGLDGEVVAAGPVRNVTEPSGFTGSLAWAPNGRTILFDHSPVGVDGLRLWTTAADGTGKPEFFGATGRGACCLAVSWSAARIAYAQMDSDFDLWSVGEVAARSAVSSTRRDFNPHFSPDGRRIAFSSWRSGRSEVWLADWPGAKAVQVTTSRASGSPRWSPDGRSIVYDTLTADGHWDIGVIDPSGGHPVQLVRDAADDIMPSFSRDGKWVYFTSDRSGRDEIYRVPASGGEAVRVTDDGGIVGFESADGRSVYYTKAPGMACVALFVRPLGGGPERQVVDSVCGVGITVSERGIYYIDGSSKERVWTVKLFEPESGKTRTITEIPGRPALGVGLTASPDGKTFVVSAGYQGGTDLMMVENFR